MSTLVQSSYFSLKNEELDLVQELRAPTTKVGFALQLGYFKSNGKFYTSDQFREQDINFVTKMLDLESKNIDLSTYKKKIYNDHHIKILNLLAWQPFNKIQQGKIDEYVQWLVQRQLALKPIFLSIIDFC